MSIEINKIQILNAIKNHYTNGSKTKLAEKLGVKPQTVSTWFSRNTFNIELLYSKLEGIDAHWLLTGEGEMLRKEYRHIDKRTKNVRWQKKDSLEDLIVDRILDKFNLKSLVGLYELNNIQIEILERIEKLEESESKRNLLSK